MYSYRWKVFKLNGEVGEMKFWYIGSFQTAAEIADFVNTNDLRPGEFVILEVAHARSEGEVRYLLPEIRVMYYAKEILV